MKLKRTNSYFLSTT